MLRAKVVRKTVLKFEIYIRASLLKKFSSDEVLECFHILINSCIAGLQS